MSDMSITVIYHGMSLTVLYMYMLVYVLVKYCYQNVIPHRDTTHQMHKIIPHRNLQNYNISNS